MTKFEFKRPKRKINTVFIHCTASDYAYHDNPEAINEMHKQRGWGGAHRNKPLGAIGYHYMITRNPAAIHVCRDIERVGAHVSGHNTRSIGIVLHGLSKDKFTRDQFDLLREFCDQVNEAYGGAIRFRGHREVAAKTCPVFDYQTVLGLDDEGYMPLRADEEPEAEPDGDQAQTWIGQLPDIGTKAPDESTPEFRFWRINRIIREAQPNGVEDLVNLIGDIDMHARVGHNMLAMEREAASKK